LAAALLAACGSSSPSAPALPTWQQGLPEASVMGARRGLVPARGIIHLHSPYSHDACDNMPRANANDTGPIDEACLDDLRTALCTDEIDYAALSDHADSMAAEDFTTLFSMRGSDVAIMDSAGEQIASQMTCADGHVVTFTIGSESPLMPIMLDRHVPGDGSARAALYGEVDATAVAAFHDAGGLAWIAHTEQYTHDQLTALGPDGVELYNLHANIDPKIRPMYLGLDAEGAIEAVANFADTNPGGPEPDLALLSFLLPSGPALDRWNEQLADGKHMPATAGTDAHENVLPIILADGERGDSYRRMLRWFSNVALVADPHDPAQVKAAVAAGKMFVVFEIMGTPAGFDAFAQTAAGATAELGDQLAVADGATYTLDVPTVLGLDPTLPAPAIHASIIRVDASGPTVIATGDGPVLTAPMSAPGAYRAEVTIVPSHWGPYLGDLGPDIAAVEQPWIYANPIYVQ
jgi:hypothetical protein